MTAGCLNLSVVNFQAVWGDKASNLSLILGYIEAAAKLGSGMVLFPEMALTGYDAEPGVTGRDSMQARLAEAVPGPSANAVAALTKRLGIYAVFGMPTRDEDNIYNSTVVCGPEGVVGKYDKLHLGGDELAWAARGERLPFIFDTPYGRVMTALSEDTYYFHEVLRYGRAKDVRLYLNSAASYDAHMRAAYQKIMERHVGLNTLHLATANLTGEGKHLSFFGGSHILSPGEPIELPKLVAGNAFKADAARLPGMYTAVLDLEASVIMPHYPYFEHNFKVGTPDWRPDIYRDMFDDVLRDPKWAQ